MELKRIVARDARSAHERAMTLYGRDALVIATAQIDGQTELVVAVEPSAPPAQGVGGGDEGGAVSPFQAAMEAVMHLRQAAAAQADAPFVTSARPDPAPGAARPEPAPATTRPQPPTAPRAASTTAFTPLAPVSVTDTTAEALRGREIVELVRREIAQLRAEFLAVQRQGRHRGPSLAPEVEAIALRLPRASISAPSMPTCTTPSMTLRASETPTEIATPV